ncbi:hypothetical protein [Paenibacillus caui]|uniref:hypothetical protein n=1 Tax=Paenibacillus caui TaxID=2873927 RepID=UPI001CA7C8AA|nr:hypothetical protein [Paenibacillus caui]
MMKNSHGEEDYTKLFVEFSDLAQRIFRKILIGLLIGLCLSQSLLRIPPVRSVISSAERWEGERPRAFSIPVQNTKRE